MVPGANVRGVRGVMVLAKWAVHGIMRIMVLVMSRTIMAVMRRGLHFIEKWVGEMHANVEALLPGVDIASAVRTSVNRTRVIRARTLLSLWTTLIFHFESAIGQSPSTGVSWISWLVGVRVPKFFVRIRIGVESAHVALLPMVVLKRFFCEADAILGSHNRRWRIMPPSRLSDVSAPAIVPRVRVLWSALNLHMP